MPAADRSPTSASNPEPTFRRSFSTPSYGAPHFEDDDVVIGMSLISLAENEKNKKKKGWKSGWRRGSASESGLRSPKEESLGVRRCSTGEEKKEKGKTVFGWTKWTRRNSEPNVRTLMVPEANHIEETVLSSPPVVKELSTEQVIPAAPPSPTHRSPDPLVEGTRRRPRLGNFARTRYVNCPHFARLTSSKKVYTVDGLLQSCISKLSVSAPLALREQMLLYRLLQRLSARNRTSLRGCVSESDGPGNRNSYPSLLRSRTIPIQPLIPSSYFDRPTPPAPPSSPYPDSPLPRSPSSSDLNPITKSPSLRKRLVGKIAKPRRRSSVKKANPLSPSPENHMHKSSTKRKKKKEKEAEIEEEEEGEDARKNEITGTSEHQPISELDETNRKKSEKISNDLDSGKRPFPLHKSSTIQPFFPPDSSFSERDTNESPSFSPNTIQSRKNSMLTFRAPLKTWVASTIFQRESHETCDWIENPVFEVVENSDTAGASDETLPSSSTSSTFQSHPSYLKLGFEEPLAKQAEIHQYTLVKEATESH